MLCFRLLRWFYLPVLMPGSMPALLPGFNARFTARFYCLVLSPVAVEGCRSYEAVSLDVEEPVPVPTWVMVSLSVFVVSLVTSLPSPASVHA